MKAKAWQMITNSRLYLRTSDGSRALGQCANHRQAADIYYLVVGIQTKHTLTLGRPGG